MTGVSWGLGIGFLNFGFPGDLGIPCFGVLGIRALGSSRGCRTWGHRGVWDLYPGVWDPQSQNGAPNFGVPPKGKVITLKIENFLGTGQHRGCGPYWVGFIQGTGGFLRVQGVGIPGGPVISTSRTVLVSVNWG